MWDLLRFFSILLTGVVLGCAGYWIGFIAFPNVSHPVARIGGAVIGGILGFCIAVWLNTRPLNRADREV